MRDFRENLDYNLNKLVSRLIFQKSILWYFTKIIRMLKEIAGKIWRKLTPSFRRRIVLLTQEQFTASAAAVIVNDAGEVLLLDHVLRPASGWGIPGGYLTLGEQPEETVRRELLEEAGIELSDIKLCGVRAVNEHLEILFFARSNAETFTLSREINEARWFKVGAMPEKMSGSQKSIVEKILRDNL